MSTSFEIPEADLLTTGTVGPPGQRVFFIQARQGDQVVSLRLEKAQVAALVTHLGVVMADLPPPGPLPTDLDLIEPVVAEWVVGSLGVSYEEDDDRVVLVAEELVDDEDQDPARVVIRATREQAAAFSMHGATVVEAGRPPCPLCGQPLDAEGHVCIRLNGHRQVR
ncbi:MAG TPA: DUF3090 family protein [Acidimicrobiales bacterium]|nr:DUF3090 family protein [Acidimicrobiales bacterium]